MKTLLSIFLLALSLSSLAEIPNCKSEFYRGKKFLVFDDARGDNEESLIVTGFHIHFETLSECINYQINHAQDKDIVKMKVLFTQSNGNKIYLVINNLDGNH